MNQENSNSPLNIFDSIREDAESKILSNADSSIPRIIIGKATCGIAAGALDTENAFKEILEQQDLEAVISSTGCIGHCYAEPVVIIDHPDSGFPPSFTRMSPQARPGCLLSLSLGRETPFLNICSGP